PADSDRGQPTSRQDRALVEQVLERFEDSWRRGQRPAIADYLPADPTEREIILIELVHTDLEYRLKAGEAVRVEEYWRQFPVLAEQREAALDLIATEYQLRRRLAQPVTLDEYVERFPQFRDELLSLPSRQSSWDARSTEKTGLPSRPKVPAGERPFIPGYEILDELGRGGMGVVDKARPLSLQRLVALKMILAGDQAGAEELERFFQEAEAVARMEHPHIVKIHDIDRLARRPYFTTEFVEGGNLAQKMAGTPQPPPQAAQLIETL